MNDLARKNPLRLRREAAGMTRADVARRSGSSYPALNQLENCLARRMSSKTASRLAALYNTTPETLQDEFAAFRDGLPEWEREAA